MSREISALIDSLLPNYPGGVALPAKGTLVAPLRVNQSKLTHSTYPIKVLLVTKCQTERQGEVTEFLNSLVTKGLRCALGDARIVLNGEVNSELQKSAEITIFLSGQREKPDFGSIVRSGDQIVVHTHLAVGALDSAEVKRELWNHLKQLLKS